MLVKIKEGRVKGYYTMSEKHTGTDTTLTPLQAHLASLDACLDAREWAGVKTAREAWETCDRADWLLLLWWAAHTPVNSKSDIVRCAARIARTVAYLNTDPRVMAAIVAAEAWADNPNSETVEQAARASWMAGVVGTRVAEAAWVAWTAAWAAAWAAWAERAVVTAAEIQPPSAIDYCSMIRTYLAQPWKETEEIAQ